MGTTMAVVVMTSRTGPTKTNKNGHGPDLLDRDGVSQNADFQQS